MKMLTPIDNKVKAVNISFATPMQPLNKQIDDLAQYAKPYIR